MASTTDIRTEKYIFKQDTTYLSENNWCNFFRNSLPEGFVSHFAYWNNLTSKLRIESYSAIIDGLLAYPSSSSALNYDPVSPSEVDCLYCLDFDYYDTKLVKITGISASVNDAIGFLTQIMTEYSKSLSTIRNYLNSAIGTGLFMLPIAYGIYNHGFWDLTKIIHPGGESMPVVVNSSASSVDTPYCGNLSQDGLEQIYGKHDYTVTLKSDYTPSEHHLYPVPAVSMDPATICIENQKSSAVTIKLPLSYHDMYFDYMTDGTWTEDSGYMTYSLAAGSTIAITSKQVLQNYYQSGGVRYPKSVYTVSQLVKSA